MGIRLRELKSYLKEEFIHHLPFTLLGVLFGLGLILCLKTVFASVVIGEKEYHVAHLIHVLFSAAASAAIFKSYRDSVIKAIPIAVISSILLCTTSDFLIPFLGLQIFSYPSELHICALEHPSMSIAFSLIGAVIGVLGIRYFDHCNRTFHLAHIFISTAASTFFVLHFITVLSIKALFALATTIFFALAIPCLAGDIVIPLCFVAIRKEYLHEKVHHSK